MKVSVVIVHFNTSDDLHRCLKSIEQSPPACEYSVTVVDNASSDPGLDKVVNRFTNVNWIMNEQNSGFAKGSNIGINSIEADWYLILNPDIVVQAGAFDRLIEYAKKHTNAGLIGPQLLNDDGSIQDSCRRFYDFKTLLMRRTFLSKFPFGKKIIDRHLMHDFDHRQNMPVDWVIGGCIFVRHEAIAKIGLMDERFFLYFEDVDWCYRMWQSGWEVHYLADSHFYHRHRRDSAAGPMQKSFWLHLFSMISFYEKWGMLVYLIKRWRDPLSSLLMWSLDMIAINTAFVSAYYFRKLITSFFPEELYSFSEYVPLQLFASLLASITFIMLGRYSSGFARRLPTTVQRLNHVWAVSLLLLASTYLSHQSVYSRAVLLLFIPMFAVATSIAEGIFRSVRGKMEKGWLSLERTLLSGKTEEIKKWLNETEDKKSYGIDCVGYIADHPDTEIDIPYLGSNDKLIETVNNYRVSQLVFWEWPDGSFETINRLALLREMRVRLRWQLPETILLNNGAKYETFAGASSAVLDPDAGKPAVRLLVKIIDSIVGVLLFLISLPFWLTTVNSRKTASYALSDGSVKTFKVACTSDGKIRPIIFQNKLAMELMLSRISFIGKKPLLHKPATHTKAWDVVGSKPSMTGVWAGLDSKQQLSLLWNDPAGLSSAMDYEQEK